jgi:polyhydroxyalkanoate synthesis regulator phasin
VSEVKLEEKSIEELLMDVKFYVIVIESHVESLKATIDRLKEVLRVLESKLVSTHGV